MPVKSAPTRPATYSAQPSAPPVASADEMIPSFDQKPANGGIPTRARIADEEREVRSRHDLLEATHPPDVLLAVQMMDDEARRHEQQRLEEGVCHEVEHRVPVRADPRRHEHVADLRHRRVRDHALDVPLHERDGSRDQERHRAEPGGEVLHVGGGLEDRGARGRAGRRRR